jgi:hypothetical protein
MVRVVASPQGSWGWGAIDTWESTTVDVYKVTGGGFATKADQGVLGGLFHSRSLGARHPLGILLS